MPITQRIFLTVMPDGDLIIANNAPSPMADELGAVTYSVPFHITVQAVLEWQQKGCPETDIFKLN